MATNGSFFEMVRHPLKLRWAEVIAVEDVTPQMRRVTFEGPDLADFTSLSPEDHIKVFFPAPGKDVPVVPSLGEHGMVMPEGEKPIARDYTVRRYDAGQQRLEIDFYLHASGGPAASWAHAVTVGRKLAFGGPRGSRVLQREFDWQLFVGDETALPEVARRIDEGNAGKRTLVIMAVNGPAEEQSLGDPAKVTVEWIHRPSPHANVGAEYREAIARLLPSEGEGFVWLAGEASELRAAHEELVKVRGFDKARVKASGHWKRGVVNHDHHEPIAP